MIKFDDIICTNKAYVVFTQNDVSFFLYVICVYLGSQQNESPDGAQAKTLTSFPTQNTSPTQNTPTQNADLPSQQSGKSGTCM